MNYDLFTLMPWRSIPPTLINRFIGDDSYVLPMGISLSVSSDRKRAYIHISTANAAYDTLKVKQIGVRREDLADAYTDMAAKLAVDEAYLQANQLTPNRVFAKTDTFTKQMLDKVGVQVSGYRVTISEQNNPRLKAQLIRVSRHIPKRLQAYSDGKECLICYHWPVDFTTKDLRRTLSYFEWKFKEYEDKLMKDFELLRERVRARKQSGAVL